MCSLNAQTIMARTDLVGEGGSQYMKVVCAHSEGADRWRTEIEAREAAMLR